MKQYCLLRILCRRKTFFAYVQTAQYPSRSGNTRKDVLYLLAKEYEYSQALHSEKEDIIRKLDLSDEEALDPILLSLQEEGLVHLWIDHRGKIKLAKITWQGLNAIGNVQLHYGLDKSILEE